MLRDGNKDLIYAQAEPLQYVDSMQAERNAIL